MFVPPRRLLGGAGMPGGAGMQGSRTLTKDPKSQLNVFVQRYVKRSVTKEDIQYSMVKDGNQTQATVTLVCMDGMQFAGELATNDKDAQKNAAEVALKYFGDEVAPLLTQPPKDPKKAAKKRKAAEALGAGGAGVGLLKPAGAQKAVKGVPAGNTAKTMLNNLLMCIHRRTPTKEDLQYQTVQTISGHQCTLSIPSLPSDGNSSPQWAGEVAPDAKAAAENAARHALVSLMEDPTVAATASPSIAAWLQGVGQAKGQVGKLIKPTKPGQPAKKAKQAKQGNQGNGGVKPSADLARQRVADVPVLGVLEEWKGKFGWITLSEPVEHPMKEKNKGRVYLSLKDWPEGAPAPAKGTTVQFYLYADASGLGAEEITPL